MASIIKIGSIFSGGTLYMLCNLNQSSESLYSYSRFCYTFCQGKRLSVSLMLRTSKINSFSKGEGNV